MVALQWSSQISNMSNYVKKKPEFVRADISMEQLEWKSKSKNNIGLLCIDISMALLHIVSSSFQCVFGVKVLSIVSALGFFLRMSNWKITTNTITSIHSISLNVHHAFCANTLTYLYFSTKRMFHKICTVRKNAFDRTQRIGKLKSFTQNFPWKLNNKLQTNTNDANSGKKPRTHTRNIICENDNMNVTIPESGKKVKEEKTKNLAHTIGSSYCRFGCTNKIMNKLHTLLQW